MKIALVYSTLGTYWTSCKTIQANLVESLKIFNAQVLFHHYEYPENDSELEDLAHRIVSDSMEQIFFLGHYPHPLSLVKKLKQLLPLNIKFTFYIYGDFCLSLKQWYETFELLSDRSVTILCGSQAHAGLLEKFFETSIKVIPFPVDTKIFYPRTIGTSQKKLNFIYTGRLSFEKQIHHLIIFLFKIYDKGLLPQGFELRLVGNFDDVHQPFFGENGIYGSYYFYLFDIVAKQVGRERFLEKIKFLGHKTHDQIALELAESDVFISLSTFSNEDFGMAAAEALESGLPALLSAWGGHHGFKSIYSDQVQLIDCVMKDNRAVPELNSFENALLKTINELKKYKPTGKLSIESIALEFRNHFSISQDQRLNLKPLFFELTRASEFDPYFEEVYESYFKG